jgi:hypothetical protein
VDPSSVRIYGPVQYEGSFKVLHEKGIKITDYKVDYPNKGSGRPERKKE